MRDPLKVCDDLFKNSLLDASNSLGSRIFTQNKKLLLTEENLIVHPSAGMIRIRFAGRKCGFPLSRKTAPRASILLLTV